jgi:hypothetical protein
VVKALQARLRGAFICPADEGYEHARKVWNGMINKWPSLIARCTGVAEEPFSTGGVYVNHLGADEPERVWAAYGHNYERLMRVKQQYDPSNFFRLHQNIKLTM